MKFWVPILLLLIVLGIAILLRTRERFSSGAVDPVCSDGLVLVGEKCRGEGSMSENGQCPEGTSMNEEGMCQRLEDPRCAPYYTLSVENGVAKCEPENAPAEPSDEEMMARQRRAEQTTSTTNNLKPTCPTGLVLIEDMGYCGHSWSGDKVADAICPPNHEIKISNGVSRCEPVVPPAAEATTTPVTEGGVTPADVRKNNVLGPVFTSYGSPVDGGDPNAWKSNQYPELLGGGDPAARQRERGAGGGFGFGFGSLAGGDLQGAMPTAAGLGATEQSRFFPTSRQPGDMELIPDPYRVSQQFSSASYSFKTEPTPFLTDFSAFFR
jgi:hypothetical protein